MCIVATSITAMLFLADLFFTWSISRVPAFDIRDNEKVDYIFLGDSRTISLRPDYLSYITGKKVLNFSAPAFTLDNNRELLEYFFRRGNTVEKVVLQVDQKFGSRTGNQRNYEYMPHLIRENPLEPRFPFQFYAKNNKNIGPRHVIRGLRYDEVASRRRPGQVPDTLGKVTQFRYNPKLMVDHSLESFRIEDIIALRDYLKGKGVKELILYSPPLMQQWNWIQSDTVSFKRKVRDAGFRYFDLSNLYPDSTYFNDQLHVRNQKDMEYCRLVASEILRVP
ncbi:MAG: hypothetical protein EBZ67_06015 [Chitinophagia bacterium]|nr:hypothetical protein [Chitinophagia bacterium]